MEIMGDEALPVLNDDGAVFHLMRRVLQQHTAQWSAALPHMTKTQWAVLRAVATEPDNDQNLIGERTAIDKATLVPMITRLVERGWLTRGPDPHDRRRRRLALTTAGRTALTEAAPLVAGIDMSALAPLTSAARTSLRETLARLAAHRPGGQ
jgi:DNA-binding MarR family transcriptional regulator